MNKTKLSVLLAAYEAFPFYKRGGLGDVMGSLPKALRDIGIDARVVMPYYHVVQQQFPQQKIGEASLRFGKELRQVRFYQGVSAKTGVPVYFIENQKYINLTNKNVKKIEGFTFFSLSVCSLIIWLAEQNLWRPSIVHCNDWHVALIPLILQKKLQSSIPTLLTIHNLYYQGIGSERILDLLNIEDKDAKILQRGQPANEINILGEGVLHANALSTVSLSYAKEILHDHSRNVIYRYLKARNTEKHILKKLIGILNGVDYTLWNPANSPFIKQRYTIDTLSLGKRSSKQYLLDRYQLVDRSMIVIIGRLAAQKGIDVIARSIEGLVKQNINLLILGRGHPAIEKVARRLSLRYPANVRVEITYSEELAHEFYAGADFVLMPSHYEPCGLVQMVAMRYGTIPIASRTGGLIDSIEDGKTGFLFKPGSPQDLVKAVKRSLEVYRDAKLLQAMRERCMRQDFSWDKSAKEYKKLYQDLLSSR